MIKDIKKVAIKNGGLVITYDDYKSEGDYTDEVNRTCPQIIHPDLQLAFDKLKAHVVCVCEMPEMNNIDESNLDTIHEELKNIVVTGFSIGGSDESAGVSIVAQRLLKGSKVLPVNMPFTQYESEDYPFSSELQLAVEACEYEVKEYLENGKFGVKQSEMEFAPHSDEEARNIAEAENTGENLTELKKRKGSGKKKKAETEVVAEF
ncbi:hypothetical protein GGR21_002503 [Dysgonomonas hofstadii]|uniref:Uncharacterized protein n=1 Tax=Dysgonomonas hofstadii TaxID=637886 RepID=A0A840CKL1_9BACT|nr:hypothetical protein [Dysgonomonas hofstadii]MBB4036597.1 hypothetical protein [Dysgonomonas hofstadii]